MTGPVAPNELERLLVVAANDPAERPAFAQALLVHDVYALGRSDPPSVNGLIRPGAKVGFASLKDAHGPMVPFFTSRERLEAALAAWPGADPSFFCLPGRSFLELTRGSRLVLNPTADHGRYYAAPSRRSCPSRMVRRAGRPSGLPPRNRLCRSGGRD